MQALYHCAVHPALILLIIIHVYSNYLSCFISYLRIVYSVI